MHMKFGNFIVLVVSCTINTFLLNAEVYSGVCGVNLSWSFNTEDSTLTITGTGTMSEPEYSSSIPWHQFRTNIAYISLPIGLTTISSHAFSQCNIQSINIPDGVREIKNNAFLNCTKLSNINITDSVTTIGNGAFENCTSLTSITIPQNLMYIGTAIFKGCLNINKIIWNAQNAFDITSNTYHPFYLIAEQISSFIFGPKVKYIPKNLCNNMSNIDSITIPTNITGVGANVFLGCSKLKCVTWNAANATIENSRYSAPFYYVRTQITSFTFGDSVERIPAYLCYEMGNLTSIVIPANITQIGDYAFYSCNKLSSINVLCNTPPTIYYNTFYNTNNSTIYIPCNTLNAYTTKWSSLQSRLKYAPLAFSVIGIANGDGIVKVPMNICDEMEIEAIPSNGSYFKKWTDGAIINPRPFNIVQDTMFTAIFAPKLKITYHYENICGKISGPEEAIPGDTIFVTAISNYGYHFAKWSDGITDNPRTIVMTCDTTFTAEFAPNSYTITTESSNAEWGYTIGDTTAFYSTQVEITAISNYGYHFDHWSDYEYNSNWEWDYSRTNPRTITITEDKTYQAVFAKNVYNITKECDYSQGQVYGPSQSEYLNNVSLTAYPNFGYHFTQWSDGETDNPRTFVITQDTTFTAEFELTTSGQCGDNLYWAYNNNVLTFSGSGDMYNYDNYYNPVPWKLFVNEVENVVFASEMTSIGSYACANMANLSHINIPSSVQTIGNYAFANINNRAISNIVLPSNIVTIGDYAFAGNTYIEQIDFGKSMEYIGAYAFQNCSRVTTMTCLAEVTPDVGTDALASISNYAELFVLNSAIRKYQVDANWNRFLLKVIGAEETTMTQNDVIIVPTDNSATITWPTTANADTYTIEITKEGEIFCILTFNADGQLAGIAFAPNRNGIRHAPAAVMMANGLLFTVTGLNSNTQYGYKVTVKDANDQPVATYSGNFTTTGEGVATGIDEVLSDQVPSTKVSKVLRDGQIFILRGDKKYTVTGQEVK